MNDPFQEGYEPKMNSHSTMRHPSFSKDINYSLFLGLSSSNREGNFRRLESAGDGHPGRVNPRPPALPAAHFRPRGPRRRGFGASPEGRVSEGIPRPPGEWPGACSASSDSPSP